MGCAESRNTVQPQVGGSTFSVVTPGVSSPPTATTASASRSGVSRFFQRSAAASQAKPKRHKPNTLLPEPLPPVPATPAGPSSSLTIASPTAALATSPNITAIANAKPATPSPAAAVAATASAVTTGPSPRLLPTDKQNLAHLTFEELSIQFLKAVKNGDLAYMDCVAQQAVRSSHAPLINIRGMWESTPLIYACQYCHPEAAMWLLEHGANVHMQNEKGVTPLLLASLEGMTGVVDWILTQHRSSADSSSSSSGASTEPLDTVVPIDKQVGVVPIDKQVGVVYNSVADLNIRVTPLLAASMNGHVEIVAKLIEHGASVNCGVPAAASSASAAKQFALLLAAKYGHARVVRLLIKHGADFATSDANGNHALLLTCEASKEECAMELLRLLPGAPLALEPVEAAQGTSSGGDASSGSGDIANTAASSPPPLVSNSYVTAWKQSNCHGLTALHFAAANGLLPVVQTMLVRLQWGSDRAFLNATSVNRRECALLMACRKRQSEVAQLLVTCGADFELADRGSTTALQVLKREKKDELVKLCESKKQQQTTASSSAGDTTVSRVSSAAALPVIRSNDPVSEQEVARAASGSERSAGESDLAFDMVETHGVTAESSTDNSTAQRTTAATFDWDAALESAERGTSSVAGDTLAGGGRETVAPTAMAQQSRANDLRTMSFAPHALRVSGDAPSAMVEVEGAVDMRDEAKTERIAESVGTTSSLAAAESGDSAALVDDSVKAPAEGSSSGDGGDNAATTGTTPAREEAYLSSSKRPSKPKHRKKEQTSPPRKPRQKKSVVKDVSAAAANAIATASQADSSSHERNTTPAAPIASESAHDSTLRPSLPADASASPAAATTVSAASDNRISSASLTPLPPLALEPPSLDANGADALHSRSSPRPVALATTDMTEDETPLKRERRKKTKAHSLSSSSENKKKSRQAGAGGDTSAPRPLAFDHERAPDESTSTRPAVASAAASDALD